MKLDKIGLASLIIHEKGRMEEEGGVADVSVGSVDVKNMWAAGKCRSGKGDECMGKKGSGHNSFLGNWGSFVFCFSPWPSMTEFKMLDWLNINEIKSHVVEVLKKRAFPLLLPK